MNLADAYLALLRVPVTDPWRTQNQDIYARIRDELAKRGKADGQFTQEAFEFVAGMTP